MKKYHNTFQRELHQVRKHCRAGRTDEALAAVQKLLQEWPGNAPLWILLADLIQVQGSEAGPPLDQAKAAYQQAIDLDPDSPTALIELGHYYFAVEDDVAAAIQAFDKALSLCQSLLQETLLGKAKALLELGKEKEGLTCLGELLRLLPPDGQTTATAKVSDMLHGLLAKPSPKNKGLVG